MVQIAKIVQPPKAGLAGTAVKEKSQVKFMTSSMHTKAGGTSAVAGISVKGGYLGDNPFVALPMESFDQRRIRNKAATSQLMDWLVELSVTKL